LNDGGSVNHDFLVEFIAHCNLHAKAPLPGIGAAARLYENVLKPANSARKGHWSGK
jgi:hypothetical protein